MDLVVFAGGVESGRWEDAVGVVWIESCVFTFAWFLCIFSSARLLSAILPALSCQSSFTSLSRHPNRKETDQIRAGSRSREGLSCSPSSTPFSAAPP